MIRKIIENDLIDYFEASKFVGFVLEFDQEICGEIFCHEKIWWNNSELFLDEMFIKSEMQRKGYGSERLKAIENYKKYSNKITADRCSFLSTCQLLYFDYTGFSLLFISFL